MRKSLKPTALSFPRKRETVVVTEDGNPVAALVGLGNADMETVSLSANREFIELIERSRARQDKEGGITMEEMRKKLGGYGGAGNRA